MLKKMVWSVFALLLVAVSGTCFAQSCDEEKGFVSLFNGKNLDGWVGNPNLWSVEDGAITGIASMEEGPTKLKYNNFLIYQGDVPSNFVLKFDYWISNPGNSGFQYRSWVLDGDEPYRVNGYQADFDGDASYSGIVFGEGYSGILADRGTIKVKGDSEGARFETDENLKKEVNIEGWNSYEVIANGYIFIHKINGHVMSVLVDHNEDTRRDNGVLAIQVHAGLTMKVKVKNIRIKGI